MDSNLIETARQILQNFNNSVPNFLYGIGRLQFLINQLKDFDPDKRLILRKLIDAFLIEMRAKNASDIDLGSFGCRGSIWLRIHGEKIADSVLGQYSETETDTLILNILMEQQTQDLIKYRNVDFSYSISEGGSLQRFRADVYFDLEHLAMNMRLISSEVRPISAYNFNPEVLKALSLKFVKRGLVLVTGITGSGKSTTLDSIIDANNRTVDSSIIIIGNPIEHVHDPKRCVVRHRSVGTDVLSFKEGAMQALRQDPDIIVIAEMRDADTIITTLEITDSGHKVFSTLHTSSAVESINRIIAEVPTNEQGRVRERLADVLTVVISQKLPRTLDNKRVLAKEVLLMIPSIRAAIKNDNLDEIYQMIQQSSQLGMITMEQDLKRLYDEKIISYEEGWANANNKKRFEEIAKFKV
ncbi:MAG: ATPase, T2SS/T4P/T4SS family [Candidatus Marinimicrobia bacterium]|nr:ATPase, T2SS/T4P/T4SS family [Candidatus Neomarinimicrobiota bacterium]